jgi:hypothetical protein
MGCSLAHSSNKSSQLFTFLKIGFIVLFPLFIICMQMVSNLLVFPFKYSIFGALKRNAFPDEVPVYSKKYSWGQIGVARASIPFF